MNNNGSNVSLKAINDAIEYIKNQFTQPLIDTGERLKDCYERVENSFSGVDVSDLIEEQKKKLEVLEKDLEDIFTKARLDFEQSADIIESTGSNVIDGLSE